MRARFPIGGSSAGAVTWVQLTQAHLDAGTEYVGSTADTLQGAAVSGGRCTVTANAIAGTTDGVREATGIGITLPTILPAFSATQHDVGVYLRSIQGSTITMAMAVALCTVPGSSANGVGVLVTSANRAHPTTVAATVAASTFTGDAFCRFGVSGSDASATVSAVVERVVSGAPALQASTSATVDTTVLSSVYLVIQACSYSGAQLSGATCSAEIYFAALPKVRFP